MGLGLGRCGAPRWLGLELGVRVRVTSLRCAARTWMDVHVRICMARDYPDPEPNPNPY